MPNSILKNTENFYSNNWFKVAWEETVLAFPTTKGGKNDCCFPPQTSCRLSGKVKLHHKLEQN